MPKLLQYNGIKWIEIKGAPGKDADEEKIIATILTKIPIPKDGHTPQKGVDYFDGKDGSPDTPEQTAEKLNTLQEILEQDTIKGLKDEIEKLRKSIDGVRQMRILGGGGGGSRQPRVEDFSFDGDGATTAFTLPSEPAGKGRLIWVYYNGQWLQPRVHFTIAARTMSTTFTAAPGTKIEGFLQYQ